jgi:hypothetical protein
MQLTSLTALPKGLMSSTVAVDNFVDNPGAAAPPISIGAPGNGLLNF